MFTLILSRRINRPGAVALATASSPIHTSLNRPRTTAVKLQTLLYASATQQTQLGGSDLAGAQTLAPSPEHQSQKEEQESQWKLRSHVRFASGVLAEPQVLGSYQELPFGAHRCLAPTPVELVRHPSLRSKNRRA